MPSVFGPASTLKAMHDTLEEAKAAVPSGKKNAIFVDGTYSAQDGAGLRGLYMRRTATGWNVVFEGDVDRAHGVAAKVGTVRVW